MYMCIFPPLLLLLMLLMLLMLLFRKYLARGWFQGYIVSIYPKLAHLDVTRSLPGRTSGGGAGFGGFGGFGRRYHLRQMSTTLYVPSRV
jgi:hypothetical protein